MSRGAHRSGEGRGARRREIDLKAVRWTMPAPGIKAGREFAVPLKTGALEVLEPARAPSSDSSLVSRSRTGGMLPRNAPGCVLRPAGVMQASGVCSSLKPARFQRLHASTLSDRPATMAVMEPCPGRGDSHSVFTIRGPGRINDPTDVVKATSPLSVSA